MKTTRICSTVVLTIALGLGTAHGRECKGVSFPEQMQSDGVVLKLNGLGLRQATIFRVNVYVAALYVTQMSKDANTILKSDAPKELILQFVRDVDGSDLNKGWQEGFENNARSELPALKERIETFKGFMSDAKTGEQLRLAYKPGAGVRVQVNKAVKGTIEGDDFARALFSIWLGANPPNEDLKAGLLGGACG